MRYQIVCTRKYGWNYYATVVKKVDHFRTILITFEGAQRIYPSLSCTNYTPGGSTGNLPPGVIISGAAKAHVC